MSRVDILNAFVAIFVKDSEVIATTDVARSGTSPDVLSVLSLVICGHNASPVRCLLWLSIIILMDFKKTSESPLVTRTRIAF